ncbi:coiled-coil domain-containing protein 55-domain containing protein [Phlebopus sp. FC_14]|nr:coiled-coil domain-containing protein 55-domain containing protein [Phlebopus sp. FC_14]
MKVSFSLNNKNTKPVGAAPPLKKPVAFASLDDEPVDAAPTSSSAKDATANKKLLAQNVESSVVTRRRTERELKVDATVYQYDEVWDRMQEVKHKQKEAKEVDARQRKPKYIEGLLTSAATRRLDRLRAEEKMLQHERELEGDEFADKEAFVTQAYKDQMEEVRKAEEEEKQREAADKKKRKGEPTGMVHFYRKLLEDSEQQHEEAVAATSATKTFIGPQGPTPNLTITKPPELTEKSDIELAQIAKEQGKVVELNDDNQIVDKRELLSAGLNLAAPNTRRLGIQTSIKKVTDAAEASVHRAVGTAASRREINERRAAEIRQQMEEERRRLMTESETEEARQRVVLKRNTEDDIQSARTRYMERKRRKLEEEAALASTADPS